MRDRKHLQPGEPAARPLTRRLFLNGALKATILGGLASRASIVDLLALPPQRRAFDGNLIEESYDIAHRLRDGLLQIPSLTPEGPLHDVIVVGGGVSGLMAAWESIRGGLEDVRLYEKEEYLGGNASKGHANGTDFTRATWSLARPRDRFLAQLLSDLDALDGFAPDGTPRVKRQYVGPGPDQNMLIDGRWYRGSSFTLEDVEEVLPTLPYPPDARRDQLALNHDLLEWRSRQGRDGRPAFAMPVEEGSRDADILELDRITMTEYARRKGWGARAQKSLDGWSASTIGGLASEVSAYSFLSFNALGQGGEDITMPGGNAWLAERIAERVGQERIHFGLTAVRIENQADEVRVTFVEPRTGRFSMRRARAAIVACPKHITGRMVPEMNTPERQLFRRYQYGALLMGAAWVKRTPVLKGGLPLAWYQSGDGTFINGFLVGDYNSERWRRGDPGRPNVLPLWVPLAGLVTRAELLEMPWSHWADKMAADLETLVPGMAAEITRLDVYVWGHHMVIPVPGLLTGEERHALCRPLGRITFAHSDRHGMPCFELAARAGFDAAREAAEIVRGKAPAA
jgi:hypothetical protein